MKKEEMMLWIEAVRRHYVSLEGKGESKQEEAEFFLLWHYDNYDGLRNTT